MLLNISNVSHWFGEKKVLNNVGLQIAEGQFVALVGPSGCGKSTLLKGILGTHPPLAGAISVDGVQQLRPSRRVGIVYQQYTLAPWLTALKNVALGPKLDQTEILQRVFRPFWWYKLRKKHLAEARQLLEDLGLGNARDVYPKKLSGGMRQRVAIAQALIMKPQILLLDEPFGALDEATREELQMMLLHLYQENIEAKKVGKSPPHTVVFVTHELNEAFYLADRVIGLSQYWVRPNADHGHTYGYAENGSGVGATVMFDKAAPVFTPGDPRDFSRFADLKATLRKVVFDDSTFQDPDEHVTFWSDLAEGQGTGVAVTGRREK